MNDHKLINFFLVYFLFLHLIYIFFLNSKWKLKIVRKLKLIALTYSVFGVCDVCQFISAKLSKRKPESEH